MRRIFFAGLALSGLCTWSAAALADFEAVTALGNLQGQTGQRIDGTIAEGLAGVSVRGAGDVNGDGRDDLIIGTSSGLASAADKIYIVFGKAGLLPLSFPLSKIDGSNGFIVKGLGKTIGRLVAGAGDVNGDGLADVVIGSPGRGPGGEAYVVFGRRGSSPSSLAVADLNGRNGFTLTAAASGDALGTAVSTAGDINGDGFDDVAIGAMSADPDASRVDGGSVFVVFGGPKPFPARTGIATLNGNNGFRINAARLASAVGRSLSGNGDINGDGVEDLLIGAPRTDPNDLPSAGSIYGIYGRLHGTFAPILDLEGIGGATGFVLHGAASQEGTGTSIAFAGDINGDGFDDLVTGAPNAAAPLNHQGAAYVVFGDRQMPSGVSLAAMIADGLARKFLGIDAETLTGLDVAGAGDVNGDGFSDVLVGAGYAATAAGQRTGQTYLLFGNEQGFAPRLGFLSLDGTNGSTLIGAAAESYAGYALGGGFDSNGDGFSDVVVGAPLNSPSGQIRAGSAYLVRGREPLSVVARAGTDADQTINGGAFADTLQGMGGDDILEGRGGGDLLDGGSGQNTASYEHAPGTVTASLANHANNTGDAAGDTYYAIANLRGSAFSDKLSGDLGSNALTGLRGRDVMTGGGGANTYLYLDPRDSRPGDNNRDVITDFNPGTATSAVDRIHLAFIDANRRVNGHQRFTFIGSKAFARRAGELRVGVVNGKVLAQADVTGDGLADFEIQFSNLKSTGALDAGDFLTSPN